MKDYRMFIFGKDRDVINELLRGCVEGLELDAKTVAVYGEQDFDGKTEIPKEADCVVIHHSQRELVPNSIEVLTYAADNSSADVVALNVQERDSSQSFEILYGSSMGRVFIPHNSKYTKEHVLIAASLLCALGAPIEKILLAINRLLK